jgi:hypothetical protein
MDNLEVWEELVETKAIDIIDFMCNRYLELDIDAPDEEFFGKTLDVYILLESLISDK